MKYMFFSRKNGWPNGTVINYYYTNYIDDIDNKSLCFVGKSGDEIYKLIETNYLNWENDEVLCKIHKIAKAWNKWYYYSYDTIITDRTIYI